MLRPHITARIEQRNFLFGLRINGGSTCAFAERAGNASQCEVVSDGFSANSNRRDVVNVKSCFLSGLR
jgi:hypothetical protein